MRPAGLLVRIKRRLGLVRLSCFLIALVVGGAAFTLAAADPARSGLSYVGGLVLVALAFEFGKFNIRLVANLFPNLTLAMALFSYLITVVALGLVLAASDPRVVDGRRLRSACSWASRSGSQAT